jgi:putative inorganic carbon (HCO3(-)) transporter
VTAGARPGLRLAAIPIAALLAIALAQAASAGSAVDGFERLVVFLVLGAAAVAGVLAPPAWTLSGALALTMFQAHWALLGSSVSIDRYATLLAIASVVVREARHRDGRLQTRPVDWLLIVVGLYATMSLIIDGRWGDGDSRFELIDRFGLIPFALFFVAPFAFRTERDRRVLLGTLVGMGAYLSLIAILETLRADALLVPQYIGDPSVGIHNDRARGPFLDAGANGIVMYACAVASVIAFVKWRSRRRRIFALCVAGGCMLGVLLSLTRVVWLAAAFATPITLASVRETRRFVFPAVAAGITILVVAVATVPGLAERIDRRRADTGETFWARKNSNAAAVRMVADRPLLGFGWGSFGDESFPYYRQSQDFPLTFLRNLHNVYLQNAVELGLIGACLWMAALVVAVGGGILRRGPPELRPWKIGLVAIAIAQFTAWATVPAEYILPTLLLWTWAGLAWGVDADRRPYPADRGAAAR